MGFQLQEPVKFSDVTYGVAGIAAAIVIIARLTRHPNLDAFPTVGSSSLLGSWWAGFKFLINAVDVPQEGYEKYKSAPFKVANMFGWMVILSDRKHIEELGRAPEDELSSMQAANDRLNIRYTLGDEVQDSPYHVAVIRSQLTQNIGTMYPEIRDEVVTAFNEVLDLSGRNPDWINLNIQYAFDVFKTGVALGLFPKFLRSLAVSLFTAVSRNTMRGLRHLGPIIEERLKHSNECGNEWAEKPNDLLSWLMEGAEGPQLTAEALTKRVLIVNFTAIHPTSNSFAHALFYLAANPQYVQPLRQEVEAIIEKDGWSKAALGKMRKVDSFLKECQRMEVLNALSITRKALKDFTFSDGTFIPKGTTIAVPARSIHYDEKFYENANEFQPFRFAEMHEGASGAAKRQFVSTAIEYLPFGHGNKHVCPGRFFVANVLKSMLAHVVTVYDVKLEDGATRPRGLRLGPYISPDPHAKVLFRRRVD